MEAYDDDAFFVRCVGYTQGFEKYFTIGREYEVKNGCITSDCGHTYTDESMKHGSDTGSWFLAGWYKFEEVANTTLDHVSIPFDVFCGEFGYE